MIRVPAVLALTGALALAGCGGDDDEPAGSEQGGEAAATMQMAAEESAEKPAPKGTTIKLGDSQFGRILFDSGDQAIYLFDKESGPTSECYGDCAAAWPPVLTKGEPQAAGGVKASLLGTTKRDDGTAQVTYNGHPLYYYAHEGPGEVTCHDVLEFGGLWLVVAAAGDAV